MTDRDALLEAITRDPADGLAWLALADWLEDDGQPHRAELTRLTRALLAVHRADPRRPALEARQWALLEAGTWPCAPERTLPCGLRLVLVPPATFWTGSPPEEKDHDLNEPLTPLQIERGFWVGVTPVTQAHFEAVMGTNPSHHRAVAGHDTASFPVETVDWPDAIAFCARIGGRLPTEAEWEFACRAGTTGPRYTGPVGDVPAAFHAGSRANPREVGHFPPNGFGLHDMFGNVWEMAGDTAAGFEPERSAVRGGCYQDAGGVCRAAKRLPGDEDHGSIAPGKDLGFRVVIDWRP